MKVASITETAMSQGFTSLDGWGKESGILWELMMLSVISLLDTGEQAADA
jgi:hypothetical protein